MDARESSLALALGVVREHFLTYRHALDAIRDELDTFDSPSLDVAGLADSSRHVQQLIDMLLPLEMGLGAVLRQQNSLPRVNAVDVDLDALRSIEHAGQSLARRLDPLQTRLAEVARQLQGFRGVRDLDRQIKVLEGLDDQFDRVAEAELAYAEVLADLEEPLRAHRAAIAELSSRVDAVDGVRARHERALGDLQRGLRELADLRAGEDQLGAIDLDALSDELAAFERARQTQLTALDSLGLDTLVDGLTAFEEARAEHIPDFRGRRLDGLRQQIARFSEVHGAHRDELESIELGDVIDQLAVLTSTRRRQLEGLSALSLDAVREQLGAAERARGRQQNALSALTLGELINRFDETIDRVRRIAAALGLMDLTDPRTAPPTDEDDVF